MNNFQNFTYFLSIFENIGDIERVAKIKPEVCFLGVADVCFMRGRRTRMSIISRCKFNKVVLQMGSSVLKSNKLPGWQRLPVYIRKHRTREQRNGSL